MSRRAVAVSAAALPIAGIVALGWWGAARETRWLAEATAQAVAGYLSVVTPRDRTGLDFDEPLLLSLAARLDDVVGAPVAVYRRGTPLTRTDPTLPHRLDPAVVERVRRSDAPATVGRTALVPLKDGDDWETVGVVGVVARTPPPLRWVAWGAAAAALLAVGAAVVGGARARRLALVGATAVLLAGLTHRHVARAATEASDQWLGEVQRLVELAARSPAGVNPQTLARIARGARLEVDSAGSREPVREVRGGLPRAAIGATLSRGRLLTVAAVPRERTLEWLLAGLAALVVATLGTTALARAVLHPSGSRAARRRTATAWAFLAPGLAHLAVFSAAPIAFTLWLSFHRWSLLEPVRPFVGVDNYVALAQDPLVWRSLLNTVLFTLYVPVTTALALALALVVERRGRGVTALRTVLFLPYVSSVVAIAIVWQWMYHPDVGLMNYALGLVGLGSVDWLGDPRTALLSLMIVAGWVQVGYQTVVFVAGLQGIPSQYLDAARVDGAGWWQQLRHVTLPLLRPVTLFVLVTGVIGSFQVFTFVYVMTEGNPLHATDVLVYRIYQMAWEFLQFGSASALSLALAAILFGVTWLQFRLLGQEVEHA